MKTHLLAILIFFSTTLSAQITTPVIKAGFGVDADLRANLFNGFTQSGNDDWYWNGNAGIGQFVIDTNGAAAIKAGYSSDVSPFPKRMASFFKTMSRPQFSVVNNRLWLDALFIRDYHGTDTTVFTAGADKNGMSPEYWTGGIQGIPDKNDILDMFMHVRRAGPSTTDSLWFFGAVSLANITGNRYFDFEMYQTDIYYDRPSQKWFGYGPDAGHTKWEFDAAGNITKPGDIIFSAEYQSGSLTFIEARIWIDKASMSIIPVTFNWSGQFDGAGNGSQFGYASIVPKTAGAFYTGLQCGNGEWAGPFSLVLQDNSVVTNYSARQFMEFSVNLTKLGLDPVTVFGTDICGTPFNRLVVKTRASASFTAELKDFVAPIDLFLAPRVEAVADVPLYCGMIGTSVISVQNPSTASVYTWYTTNGNIMGSNTGTSIQVNAPGTYIVQQQLAAGCNPYAFDTVTIVWDSGCVPMEQAITSFQGNLKNDKVFLSWTTQANLETEIFELQRSLDGKNFAPLAYINPRPGELHADYLYFDPVSGIDAPFTYYRLMVKRKSGTWEPSEIIRVCLLNNEAELVVYPNPAKDLVQVGFYARTKSRIEMKIYDFRGALIETRYYTVQAGSNLIQVDTRMWKDGGYLLQLHTGREVLNRKLLVSRKH